MEEANTCHDRRLMYLFERCRKNNIKLNQAKFQFKTTEVKFMGHIISDSGIKPDPDKIESIIKLQTTIEADLLRIIGMLNYLSPFCPNMSGFINLCEHLLRMGLSLYGPNQENALNDSHQHQHLCTMT